MAFFIPNIKPFVLSLEDLSPINLDSALFAAIGNGDLNEVRSLLNKGANVNAIKPERIGPGITPLYNAIVGKEPQFESHPDIALFLLEKGAHLDTQTLHKETPLHLAVERNLSGVVQSLIMRGANLDIQDDLQRTPLFIAVEKNLPSLAYSLLLNGADASIKGYSVHSDEPATPLELAEKLGRANIAQFIRTTIEKAKADLDNYPSLHPGPGGIIAGYLFG